MSLDVLNGCDMKELHVMDRGEGGVGVHCQLEGPRPELVYSYAKLLELKCHPLAKIWPVYLDTSYKNNRGLWDPDRWHLDQKRSETPSEEKGNEVEKCTREKMGREGETKEKMGREGEKSLREKGKEVERLVREKLKLTTSLGDGGKISDDAIILSPQRGSFLSGCQAVRDELSLRPDHPGQIGRRVGSGRILRQEKDEFPGTRGGTRPRIERENVREWDRDFSKYGFRREDEDRRGWDERRDGYQDERGVDRRRVGRGGGGSMMGSAGRRGRQSENEPEWMHETVLLTDIMELGGFEDGKSNKTSRPNSRQSNKSERGGSNQLASQRPQPAPSGGQSLDKEGFNFDQIMESVNLNSLLGGMGVVEQVVDEGKPASQSRFSQFFQARVESKARSRRSSIQDELLGNNILRELNGEPMIKIPSPEESNKYFTPISPAAKTGQGNNVLMEMLQKGGGVHQKPREDNVVRKLEDGIKRSLGLQKPVIEPNPQPPKQRPENDLSAFKKLVAQVKGQPGDPRQPLPGFLPGLVRPTPLSSLPPGPIPMMPNMLTEQEILEGRAMAAQRMNIHQGMPQQLLQFLEHYQLNPEVLKRPELEHLLTSINSGAFPMETLIQQLSNPSLPHRQRELILTALKIRTLNFPTPPPLQGFIAPQMMSRASPLPDHLLPQAPSHQHSRVSPLMFGGVGGSSHLAVSPGSQSRRVPSPQEMTMLTQQILQQALIKKKLEEQKENYRKKQEGKTEKEDKENLRGIRSSENGSASSPLAFTPTSVMRKSAADRKDSDPKPTVPELKITTGQENSDWSPPGPPSPGRPIKGKGADRPGSLELGGRSTRNSMLGGGGAAMGGLPPSLNNPLLFLSNPGFQPPIIGGMSGFGAGAGGLSGLMSGRFHHPGLHNGAPGLQGGAGLHGGGHPGLHGLRMPASPRGPVSPGTATPLSRFFSNDVLMAAAAAGGSRAMKMPPLPTGQALTLEEIERQAATVKI